MPPFSPSARRWQNRWSKTAPSSPGSACPSPFPATTGWSMAPPAPSFSTLCANWWKSPPCSCFKLQAGCILPRRAAGLFISGATNPADESSCMEMPRLFRLLLVLGLTSAPAVRAQNIPPSGTAAVFPDFKIYDTQGRPWRAAREDWEGARQRVASDPDWADWLKRERATVDAWMAKRHDRVEWAAGWSHDFVSPKDGTHLVYTDQIPGEETDHLFSPSDPNVAITPKLFAAWVRAFREKNVLMMERAAQLYRLTGEKRYADWAAGQMDFYTDNYLKWKPARGGARLFWQTLTEASNLVTYAHVVRNLGDYAAP